MEFGKDKPKRRTRERRKREPRASAKAAAAKKEGSTSSITSSVSSSKEGSTPGESTKYPASDARSKSGSSSSLKSRRRKRGPKKGKSLVIEREMAFPLRYMGLLIGPKGRNINLIQRASQCRIYADFEEDAPRPETAGEIRAPLDPRLTTDDRHLLKETLADDEDVKGSMPRKPVAPLIGIAGDSTRSDTKSSVINEDEMPPDRNTEMRRVLLTGSPEEIAAATRELQFIIDRGRLMLESERGFSVSGSSSSMSTTMSAKGTGGGLTDQIGEFVDDPEIAEEMRIPTKVCGMLIGSEGERIKDIQYRTGAEVYVKWDDGLSRDERQHIEASVSTVTIKGRKSSIEQAKSEIRSVLSLFGGAGGKGGSDCIFEIPAHVTKHLLGPKTGRGFTDRYSSSSGMTSASGSESAVKELQKLFKVTISIKTPTQVQNYDLLGKRVQRISIVQIVGEEVDIKAVKQEIDDLIGTFRKCDECRFLVEPSEGKPDSNGWNWYCLKCWVEWGGDDKDELAEEMARMHIREDREYQRRRGRRDTREREREREQPHPRSGGEIYIDQSAMQSRVSDKVYYDSGYNRDDFPGLRDYDKDHGSLKYGMVPVGDPGTSGSRRTEIGESGTGFGGEDLDLEGYQEWDMRGPHAGSAGSPYRRSDDGSGSPPRSGRYREGERRRKPPRPSTVHY